MKLYHGDMRDVLASFERNSLEAVITDPPYELGFMGKEWDRSGVAFQPETWAAVYRVLKPGGWLAAMGGTRTAHRLACAIEDAGFEIRDTLQWIYGSGFPKGIDVGKAIDQKLGAARDVVGTKMGASNGQDCGIVFGAFIQDEGKYISVTAPATPEAAEWDGWNVALKPSHEPILLCRKPLEGTVAENVLKWQTGGINIGACRIGTEQTGTLRNGHSGENGIYGRDAREFTRVNPPGRWPANLIFSHSPGCVRVGEKRALADEDGLETVAAWECEAGCPVALLDRQSGESRGSDRQRWHQRGTLRFDGENSRPCHGDGVFSTECYADSGGASRFFTCLEPEASFIYVPKPARRERDIGCQHLQEGRSTHPTVKPVNLLAWLCRLLIPPDGTVLDPFMGSGSTGVAAKMEGFEFIGIEQEEEYLEIAEARIAHAARQAGRARPLVVPGPVRLAVTPLQGAFSFDDA